MEVQFLNWGLFCIDRDAFNDAFLHSGLTISIPIIRGGLKKVPKVVAGKKNIQLGRYLLQNDTYVEKSTLRVNSLLDKI